MLIGPWSHIGLLDNRVGHARSGMFSAFALHSYALDFARRCCAAQPASDAAVHPNPGAAPAGPPAEAVRKPDTEAHAAGAAAATAGLSGNKRADGEPSPEPGLGAGSGLGRSGNAPAASGVAAGRMAAAAGEPGRPMPECNGSAHSAELHPPDVAGSMPAAEPGAEPGPAAMELPADRMPIHYYIMGWRPRWAAAPRWPPPEASPEPLRLYLAPRAAEPDLALPERAHVRAVPGGRTAAVRRLRNPLGVTFPQPEFLQAAGGTARPLQLSKNPRGPEPPADAVPAASGAAGTGAVSSSNMHSAPDSAGSTGTGAAGGADVEAGVNLASQGIETIDEPTVGACGRRTGSTAQVRQLGWLWCSG